MNTYITAALIADLRRQKHLTQKELADRLCVSDKTVSKWESGNGFPDITLLEPLAEALSVSVAELFSGDKITNRNRCGNWLRSRFYVCPLCGNVIHAGGEALIHCCGIALPPLEAEETDSAHEIHIDRVENESYITVNHPMEKQHYLSFIAFVGGDRCDIRKLYPEGNAETRLTVRGHGDILVYCNRHGLMRRRV